MEATNPPSRPTSTAVDLRGLGLDEYEGAASRGELEEIASAMDCTAVFPKPGQLFLDLDGAEALARYTGNLKFLRDVLDVQGGYGLVEVARWPSRSGQGMHVVLRISAPWHDADAPWLEPGEVKPEAVAAELEEKFPLTLRLLFQAVLGSDVRRELCSWRDHLRECEEPVTLFKPNTPPANPGGAWTTQPKYLLFPGQIWSEPDNKVVFVEADALAELYGVDLRDCAVVPHASQVKDGAAPLDPNTYPGALHLWPQRSGKYVLPKVTF